MKTKILQMLIILGLSSFLANYGNAAEISGSQFLPKYKDGAVEMNLQGIGSKSVLFMKAFVAAFYIEEGMAENPMANIPKHLEVEYFVRIPAKKLNNYTVERMAENISQEEMAALNKEIELMGQYFVDLAPGDRFALTYIPDLGTKFTHNDQLVGVVQGAQFAKALFSVWIGEKPFDERLKNQILGLENIEVHDNLVLSIK
ncbi:MAG: chalcone isomerase family protein [Candidatus Omnitrophica bacterium]|nr:chalcone isomerase family protein [Candidatus Omnitrophota bacterium]